jgi:tellurite resistance-related uncharacterized protein
VGHERRGPSKLGAKLNCVRCDAFELPDNFVTYKTTEAFSETTMPAGLRKDHATKAGVWARIVVSEGRLHYRVHPPLERSVELAPGCPGIVVPEVRHRGALAVRFHVEFLRAPTESA